jgi:CheY-like chemotaxis protein
MPNRSVILLVEDREEDVLLVRRAFERCGITAPLFVVRNGSDAISYLQGAGKFGSREEFPLPDLLLLDLCMPGVDGFEVLEWTRQQPGFSSLRIIVLTSSDHIRDVNEAYRLGANSFLVKPMDFNDFVELTKFLYKHWIEHSQKPELSRQEGPPRKESGTPPMRNFG